MAQTAYCVFRIFTHYALRFHICNQRETTLKTHSTNSQPKTLKPPASFWPAFVLITLIAFFLRFYRLGNLPLGVFFDPAINGLDAIRLMQRGGSVLFFPTNGGREALFVYLLIPYLWLFGTLPFSLHASTATISLVNVVLLAAFLHDIPRFGYGLTGNSQEIPGLRPPAPGPRQAAGFSWWLAVLGSLALAVSYWHLSISRLGVRPVLVSTLSVPVFWLFLKGWATGQKRWFALSGLFMGLEGYTYSAARLLPVILVLALLPEFLLLLRKKPQPPAAAPDRSHLPYGGLLIFLITALVIYAPMAGYMITHPAEFTARAFSVMVWNFLNTPTEIIAEIGRNILRVAGFFCCQGSPNPIFGLPGYPGLSPLLTPLLLIGLLSALKQSRNLFPRLIVLWWLIGLTPSILAIEAPHPLRMVVAVLPTAILIALGTLTLPHLLTHFHSRFHSPILWLALLLILATLPALYQAYFIRWPSLQTTQGIYDYNAVAIRNEVLTQAEADPTTPIYLPFSRFNDSTLLYYLSGSYQRQAALTAPPAPNALVISPEKNEQDTTWVRLQNQTATLLPPLTAEGQDLIQTALADQTARPIFAHNGEIAARLAPLPLDPVQFVQQPTQPLTATFGPIRLTGSHYNWIIDPATSTLPVTLYWQTNQSVTDEYEVILHLVDDQRRVWGDGSARPADWVYPTSFWRPDLDHIAAQHQLTIEPNTLSPGRYWLAVALYNPSREQRLPLTAGSSDSPDTYFIGPLKVPPPPPDPALLTSLDYTRPVTFGSAITLAGFAIEQPALSAGETLRLTLLWESLTHPDQDYTVFIHLLDSNDTLIAGSDTQPLAGSYPTTLWSPQERILDPHPLSIPATLPPGPYRLAIGLYHQPTGQRLPLHLPPGQPDPQGRLILPTVITITAAQE